MFVHWGGRTFHSVGSDQCLQNKVMTSFRNNQHTVTFTPGLGRGEMTIIETEGSSSCVVHTGQRRTPGLRNRELGTVTGTDIPAAAWRAEG